MSTTSRCVCGCWTRTPSTPQYVLSNLQVQWWLKLGNTLMPMGRYTYLIYTSGNTWVWAFRCFFFCCCCLSLEHRAFVPLDIIENAHHSYDMIRDGVFPVANRTSLCCFVTASVRPLWSDSGDDCGVWRRTSRVFSTHHTAPLPSLPSCWHSHP